MKVILRQFIVLCTFLPFTSGFRAVNQDEFRISRARDVIEWVVGEEEGYLNPKVTVNKDGYLVVADDIAENELVLSIPSHVVIGPIPEDNGEEEMEQPQTIYACDTAWSLVEEYNDLDESPVSAYITYLLSQQDWRNDNPLLPDNWSPEGKQWIQTILGGELEPQGFGTSHVDHKDCLGEIYKDQDEENQQFFFQALKMVYARGSDKVLVPLLDMVQHSNKDFNLIRLNSTDSSSSSMSALSNYHFGASRNIRQGEVLSLTRYTTSHAFQQLGVVESYPRRWSFVTGHEPPIVEDPQVDKAQNHPPEKDEFWQEVKETRSVPFQFEVNQDENGKFVVSWLSGEPPNMKQINWLSSHRNRLENLLFEAESTPPIHGRELETALQYLLATKEALDQAFFWAKGFATECKSELLNNVEECSSAQKRGKVESNYPSRVDSESSIAGIGGTGRHLSPHSRELVESFSAATGETFTTEVICQNQFDALAEKPDLLKYNEAHVAAKCESPIYFEDIYETETTSYQHMEWARFKNEESQADDTCLLLDNVLHSCVSVRPQVHETIIHYPASFLPKMERVLYVGGGDLIILHEILKYSSLELVIGMELDQSVVRSSFRNYGVQPHFDDERVQWWFGDASKSLALLPPEEYFGSFDLVLIDLLSVVFDSLKVEGTPLIDYMMKLVKPDGILVRQEDFVQRNVVDFARYTVDLDIHGLPYMCSQSFTMGSNGIDFSKTVPYEHDIDTLWFGKANEDAPFSSIWSGVRETAIIDRKEDPAELFTQQEFRNGQLLVMEVEDVSVSLQEPLDTRNRISSALQRAGLAEINHKAIGNTHVFVLTGGYLVARVSTQINYVGIELQLWNQIDKFDRTQKEIYAALGGHAESTSKFRVTTGGMFGLDLVSNLEKKQDPLESTPNQLNKDQGNTAIPNHQRRKLHRYDVVLPEMVSMLEKLDQAVVVICPDISSSCASHEALANNSNHKTTTLYTFQGLTNQTNAFPSSVMDQSESWLRNRLLNIVSANEGNKINVIVIDPDVPVEMGQVLHRVLNKTEVRSNLLNNNFTILASSEESLSSSTWRHNLMERFRTEIVQFNPVYHATVAFQDSSANGFEMGVLSAGDPHFYSHLLKVFDLVEERTELKGSIRDSKVGLASHIPDFAPFIASQSQYDLRAAHEQWNSQNPTGHQIIAQYEVVPKSQIPAGASVLVNDIVHHSIGTWTQARVLSQNSHDSYTIEYSSNQKHSTVKRERLREIGQAALSSTRISRGDRVLVQSGNPLDWVQTVVVGEEKHLDAFKVQSYGDTGESALIARGHLIPQREQIVPLPENLECGLFENALNHAMHTMELNNTILGPNITSSRVGDGCLWVTLFSEWSLVASFDGRNHLDLNLFFSSTVAPDSASIFQNIENSLMHQVQDLTKVQHDTQPRGSGRVVNLAQDLDKHWFHRSQS